MFLDGSLRGLLGSFYLALCCFSLESRLVESKIYHWLYLRHLSLCSRAFYYDSFCRVGGRKRKLQRALGLRLPFAL